jgi:hypothetical protein
VLAGRHSFQLERLADGTTEFIESEVFTGPAAPEVIGRHLPELHAAYETSAAAFKKYVEEALEPLVVGGVHLARSLTVCAVRITPLSG